MNARFNVRWPCLPPAPVYSVVLHPDDPQIVYLGTENGVFERTSDSPDKDSADENAATKARWLNSLNGLPDCPVTELTWMNSTLVAATHGRGMYMIDQTLKKK